MNIVFYAYGNHQMGMGHLYRSDALISTFQKKVKVVLPAFLSLDYEESINTIRDFGYQCFRIPTGLSEQQEIEFCSDILTTLQPEVLVADALRISPPKMALFKERSKYLVSIDDTGDGRLLANLAINVLYQPATRSDRLLELKGLKYFILREECSPSLRSAVNINPVVRRILITQGGSDTNGTTVKIARALDKFDDEIEIVLLLGSAFKHGKELQTFLQNSRRHFTIKSNIKDVIKLFSQCDLAITGAGITLFELLAVGIPCIVSTQEHKEIETANSLESYGFIRNLGPIENVPEEGIYQSVKELCEDYSLRKAMSEKSRYAVDGLGTERVVNVILSELRAKAVAI
jgi:spore coat polysaccharide biosynthesis predicted glycosyltransferase SpsG